MWNTMRFQVLTCMLVFTSCADSIMVKFGTNDGPIVPPTPTPPPPPPALPYRDPAPVWESRDDDTPDPNAQWRPQLFIPQPRYTQVVYKQEQPSINNAKQFVNAYSPQYKPVKAKPIGQYFTPTQMIAQLSSQSVPGFGIRYFVPAFVDQTQKQKEEKRKEEETKINEIETNEIDTARDASSDLQWKSEKVAAQSQRIARRTFEGNYNLPYVYQWPEFVPRRH